VGIVAKLVPGLPLFGEMFFVKSLLLFILMLTIFFPGLDEVALYFYSQHSNPIGIAIAGANDVSR
jgi:hypothetical protein